MMKRGQDALVSFLFFKVEKCRRDGQWADVQRGNDEQKRPYSDLRQNMRKEDLSEIKYMRQN